MIHIIIILVLIIVIMFVGIRVVMDGRQGRFVPQIGAKLRGRFRRGLLSKYRIRPQFRKKRVVFLRFRFFGNYLYRGRLGRLRLWIWRSRKILLQRVKIVFKSGRFLVFGFFFSCE